MKLLENQRARWGVVLGVPFLVGLGIGRASVPRYHEDFREPASLPVEAPDGSMVVFPEGSRATNLIRTTEVKQGEATVTAVAPGRVVLASSATAGRREPIILFESNDVTTLYSQYRQAKSNLVRAHRNYERTRDMYANQAATGKDLNDSENEFSMARDSLTELEVKLRTAGFNPNDLDRIAPNTAWVISDVPETEIGEVDPGEDVKITFSAFPGEIVTGRADSKGDAVDPVTRTIKVRVSLSNPRRKFMPGMFTKVDFGVLHDGAVVVPASSVVTVEDKDYVFVKIGPGKFEKRQVSTQSGGTDQALITKGVRAGDQVVSAGTMLLKGLFFPF